MRARCRIVRGLPKEVEREVNDLLARHPGRVLHVAQSEAHDQLGVTLLLVDGRESPGDAPAEPGPVER